MIIDKIFYKALFNNLFADPFQLIYWDGEIENHGEGEYKFKIIFNEYIPKAEILKDPSIAFGEAYMTNKMDIIGHIQDVIESLYNNQESFLRNSGKYSNIRKIISNTTKADNSKDNIEFHYNIGNDFYKLWLDDSMTYSCGYFINQEDSLNKAQKNKIEHILAKLNLKEGQTLLDIGCGWGELIITAAKKYKVKTLGVTLSSEQALIVKERIKNEKIEDLVEVQLMDYRELKDRKFDRIVSVGMLEHVGEYGLFEYFSSINNLLSDKGISLLHCITGIDQGGQNSWIEKYIFPGGFVPAIKDIVKNIAEQKFHLIDIESLRRHYGKTLELWAANFENSISEISRTKDEAFIRMWRMYLNSCAASFNCGNIDIHQILFSKGIDNELPWTREYMYKNN